MRSALLALCVLLTGCGTVLTQTPAFERRFNQVKCATDAPHVLPRMYSGTALDVWSVVMNPAGQVGTYLLFDIPFSVAADTVLLPYTLVRQIGSGSYRCVPTESPHPQH